MTFLRLLDVFIVVVTAPVLVLLGAPALGILVGAAAYLVQRGASVALENAARQRPDVRSAVGLNVAGAFARAWLLALTILAVGLAGDREDGLAAAILVLVAYTVYLATSQLARMLERNHAKS
jgi:hypothetical protein